MVNELARLGLLDFAGNYSTLDIPTIKITFRLQQPLQNLFRGKQGRTLQVSLEESDTAVPLGRRLDIYIIMSNGTTVGHVCPGEDMTTVCKQEEADTRIILHIIHALNCGFSSILIKSSCNYLRHEYTNMTLSELKKEKTNCNIFQRILFVCSCSFVCYKSDIIGK